MPSLLHLYTCVQHIHINFGILRHATNVMRLLRRCFYSWRCFVYLRVYVSIFVCYVLAVIAAPFYFVEEFTPNQGTVFRNHNIEPAPEHTVMLTVSGIGM